MKNRFKDANKAVIATWAILALGYMNGILIFIAPLMLVFCILIVFGILIGPQPERDHVTSFVLSVFLLTLTIVCLAGYLIWCLFLGG